MERTGIRFPNLVATQSPIRWARGWPWVTVRVQGAHCTRGLGGARHVFDAHGKGAGQAAPRRVLRFAAPRPHVGMLIHAWGAGVQGGCRHTCTPIPLEVTGESAQGAGVQIKSTEV